MKFTKLRARIAGLLAPLLVLAFAVPASIVLTSTTAHAAACSAIDDGPFNGTEKYEIPMGCSNVHVGGTHRCQVVEITYTNSGAETESDECVDIYATNISGEQSMRAVGQFYCQGAYTQCEGMHVSVDMAWTILGPGNQGFVTPVTYACNGSSPLCPSSGREQVWSGILYLSSGEDDVYAYGFDPADGGNGGLSNVLEIQGNAAYHESHELDSQNAEIFFDDVPQPTS